MVGTQCKATSLMSITILPKDQTVSCMCIQIMRNRLKSACISIQIQVTDFFVEECHIIFSLFSGSARRLLFFFPGRLNDSFIFDNFVMLFSLQYIWPVIFELLKATRNILT